MINIVQEPTTAKLRGKVEILPLGSVQPNDWNANVVPEHVMESIRHGFHVDGWLVSQALLVWSTDETGAKRNLIIDGEHRWQAAQSVGLKEGPMVRLAGLTEVEAKALTVKLNQKRGDWDMDALAKLVQEIQFGLSDADLGLELGFSDEEAMRLVAMAAEELPNDPPVHAADADVPLPPGPQSGLLTGAGPGVRTAQFFFSAEEHAELSRLIAQAAEKLGTQNPSDTVLAAVRAAAS